MKSLILAIDQGTTSTRAIAFETAPEGGLRPVAVSQIELAQHFPRPGWVEHDAAEIWRATLQTCREVIRKAGGVGRFAAVGITNQRETSVLWDAATGEPLHRAVVWQDRRTADATTRLAADGAPKLKVLKVDGGVTANAFAMQFVADICEVTVERPAFQEMTALGAAKLAALGVGLIDDLEDHPVEAPARWTPRMGADERERLLKGWRGAVKAAIIAAQ